MEPERIKGAEAVSVGPFDQKPELLSCLFISKNKAFKTIQLWSSDTRFL